MINLSYISCIRTTSNLGLQGVERVKSNLVYYGVRDYKLYLSYIYIYSRGGVSGGERW